MSRKIKILPDSLTNQIAAGEVVERPASVVKELVENSLDAAAVHINVELQNGGKTEIRIVDDGYGMCHEDALLSLDRYATSKLFVPEDLREVRTFGFRGEALPSIAAVSELTLETAESGSVGTRIRVRGGRILSVEECARQRGTTVLVRRLFGNVPARAKFLKSAAVETRAVADAMVMLVLANISSGFRLLSGGRILLDLPPAPDLPTRIAGIWGEEFAADLLAVEQEAPNLQIAGLVQRPAAAARGPRRAHLFVGSRPFKDRYLLQAVDRAYRTTISADERPSVFLYLQPAAGTVDVNVHPSKAEVRFRQRAEVEEAVEAAVRGLLGSSESAATLDRRPSLPQLGRHAPSHPPMVAGSALAEEQLAFFVPARGGDLAGAESAPPEPDGSAARSGPTPPGEGVTELPQRLSLWQVHGSFIIAETRSGLLIVDQHSAHERILFEQIMRDFEAGGASSQRLLFPLTLRLSPAEYGLVEDSRSVFQQAGFDIERFGGNTIIVQATPNPHPYFDAERCLREMLAELVAGSELTRAARSQHERIAMLFACKGAIKAGQKLSQREQEDLFQRLFATELPHHDVHGRPTVIRLSLQELERRFGRHG